MDAYNYRSFEQYSTTKCGDNRGAINSSEGMAITQRVIKAPTMVSLPFQTLFTQKSNPLTYYVPLKKK